MNDRKPVDRAQRRRILWAEQYAKADTPSKIAAVEFNRVRTLICDLPARDQAAEWKALTDLMLTMFTRLSNVTDRDIHDSHSHSAAGEGAGQPRALASARARLPRFPITRGNTERG